MDNLQTYGWTTHLENQFLKFSADRYSPGRIIVRNKTNYIVATRSGELISELTGKFYFDHDSKNEYPVVGDWVALRILHAENKGFIDHVLPRKTKISRNAAGTKAEEQIIAANVDTAFIMTSMNHDINVRRLERYMLVCAESGIQAVIVLTKSDLCENPDTIYEKVTRECSAGTLSTIYEKVTQESSAGTLSPLYERGVGGSQVRLPFMSLAF